MKLSPLLFLAIAASLLQGCAVPKTVSAYDAECQVVAKHMVLDVKTNNMASNCSNQSCLVDAVGANVVLAASTIVSGSIVVAGNVVYWLEKKRNCQMSATAAAPTPMPQ